MSMIPIAAPLIRQATVDENFARDLHESIQDPTVFEGLVNAPIEEDELRWLAPSEWQWFAHWRQARGGPLDPLLLYHLYSAASNSRSARFELRGLVMRDPRAEERATVAHRTEAFADALGLSWLRGHASEFQDSEELARDALQYATETAWFTLRMLTGPEHPSGERVRAMLHGFAEARGINPEVSRRWVDEEERDASTQSARTTPVIVGRMSGRLGRMAEGLRTATVLLGVRVTPIEVLGSGDDSGGEAEATAGGPVALLLPEEAETLLAVGLEIRAVVGGDALRVWMSGDWIPAVGSHVALYVTDSYGEIVRDEAEISVGGGQMKFVLPWSDAKPPAEALVAVFGP